MLKTISILFCTILSALLLSYCTENKVPPYADLQGIRSAGKMTAPDSQYVAEAYNKGLFEVELSQQLQNLLSNSDVKDIAEKVMARSADINDQIKELADKRGVKLSQEITKDQNDQIAKLGNENTNNFNKVYLEKIISDYKATVNLFERASENAVDEEVKKLFTAALPEIKQHLETAKAALNNFQ